MIAHVTIIGSFLESVSVASSTPIQYAVEEALWVLFPHWHFKIDVMIRFHLLLLNSFLDSAIFDSIASEVKSQSQREKGFSRRELFKLRTTS